MKQDTSKKSHRSAAKSTCIVCKTCSHHVICTNPTAASSANSLQNTNRTCRSLTWVSVAMFLFGLWAQRRLATSKPEGSSGVSGDREGEEAALFTPPRPRAGSTTKSTGEGKLEVKIVDGCEKMASSGHRGGGRRKQVHDDSPIRGRAEEAGEGGGAGWKHALTEAIT